MTDDDECYSCGEGIEEACPKSARACGHHCNHIWTHDECDWCELVLEEELP